MKLYDNSPFLLSCIEISIKIINLKVMFSVPYQLKLMAWFTTHATRLYSFIPSVPASLSLHVVLYSRYTHSIYTLPSRNKCNILPENPLHKKKPREMHSDLTPRVLSIQSHVVHGYVGNKSAVFPLQVLGFEVDSINTVQFSTHTAYKHIKGNVLKNEEMAELIEGLKINEVDYYTHFLTGYSRSPDSLKQIAEIIKSLRKRNPNLTYVCDPVMGDNGKMYVPPEILPVYRDIVVPLADILTPNQFEAELITGMKMNDLDGALKVIEALHEIGVKTVVLSSTDLGDEKNMIGIASTAGSCYKISIPKVDGSFTGTGDLFAAIFLAWSHKTNGDVKLTLEKTIATLQNIVQDTYQRARALHPAGKIPPALIELRLVQNKAVIEDPEISITAVEVNRN